MSAATSASIASGTPGVRDRWVGPVEAALMLGVNRSTIQRWIDMKELMGVKTVGGHRRIRESELRAFASRRDMPLEHAKPNNILIVDDEPEIVEFIGAMTSESRPDLLIQVARTGFEAGRLMTEKLPALVFLDLHMPGLDGIEVCHFIRRTAGLIQVRIVGITGERNPEVLDGFMAAGASEILGKPIDPARLLDIVDAVLPAPRKPADGGSR